MHRSDEGDALTRVILEVFRLNGRLLAAGDRLTGPLGLTSARWQVLGALQEEGRPLTVAQIGRRMGLSRQNVQRIANDLAGLGFLAFRDNPDHRRAKLVALTDKAEATLARLDAVQADWVNRLADGLDAATLDRAAALLGEIARRADALEAALDRDGETR
ncbi:MAG: MarR family transcriptional regulator [Alphaproteobacteria bacterium]|nr:MarR family transcriptional regulator [Alphaproteobacteria bacterium]